nr:myosin-6-like isoform X1 [Tanacetum cinerariifolium]
DLGFSQGKPVATYVIYKSILHSKAFEADITTIFDRIVQMMGSAIERSLSPSPPKPQQPTSIFGRMTQGFRAASIISIAPIVSDGKSFPVEYWDSIIERLNELLDTLKELYVPSVIIQKIFFQVFSFIDIQLFNSVLLHKECCTFANGEYVKAGLAKLDDWCSKATTE